MSLSYSNVKHGGQGIRLNTSCLLRLLLPSQSVNNFQVCPLDCLPPISACENGEPQNPEFSSAISYFLLLVTSVSLSSQLQSNNVQTKHSPAPRSCLARSQLFWQVTGCTDPTLQMRTATYSGSSNSGEPKTDIPAWV